MPTSRLGRAVAVRVHWSRDTLAFVIPALRLARQTVFVARDYF